MEDKASEKILFNRYMLNSILGKSGSNIFLMALRRENLGTPKMTRVMRTVRKSEKPVEVISSMYHYDCDEVVAYYEEKKKRYKEDVLLVSRPSHNDAWDKMIETAKKIKKHIKDSK